MDPGKESGSLSAEIRGAFAKAWEVLDLHGEKRTNEQCNALVDLKKKNPLARSDGSSPLHLTRQETFKQRELLKRTLSSAYTGPIMHDKKINAEEIFKYFSGDPCRVLYFDYFQEIITQATASFMATPTILVKIKVPKQGKLTVVGDTHGQITDVITILSYMGMPSETNYYVFNGDLVDRGPHGPAVLSLALALKICYPHYFFINRGNHEDITTNRKYAFADQCAAAYGESIMDEIQKMYKTMPYGTIINKKVLVIHGGLSQYEDMTISEIEKLPFNKGRTNHSKITTRSEFIREALLWSDPVEQLKKSQNGYWEDSNRGSGVHFGPQMTKKFLHKNQLEFIIRSHQVVEAGYLYAHDGNLVTLFSASYYDGMGTNQGAIATYTHGKKDWTKPVFYQYTANITAFVSTLGNKTLEQRERERALSSIQELIEIIFEHRHSLRLAFSKFIQQKELEVSQKKRRTSSLKERPRFHSNPPAALTATPPESPEKSIETQTASTPKQSKKHFITEKHNEDPPLSSSSPHRSKKSVSTESTDEDEEKASSKKYRKQDKQTKSVSTESTDEDEEKASSSKRHRRSLKRSHGPVLGEISLEAAPGDENPSSAAAVITKESSPSKKDKQAKGEVTSGGLKPDEQPHKEHSSKKKQLQEGEEAPHKEHSSKKNKHQQEGEEAAHKEHSSKKHKAVEGDALKPGEPHKEHSKKHKQEGEEGETKKESKKHKQEGDTQKPSDEHSSKKHKQEAAAGEEATPHKEPSSKKHKDKSGDRAAQVQDGAVDLKDSERKSIDLEKTLDEQSQTREETLKKYADALKSDEAAGSPTLEDPKRPEEAHKEPSKKHKQPTSDGSKPDEPRKESSKKHKLRSQEEAGDDATEDTNKMTSSKKHKHRHSLGDSKHQSLSPTKEESEQPSSPPSEKKPKHKEEKTEKTERSKDKDQDSSAAESSSEKKSKHKEEKTEKSKDKEQEGSGDSPSKKDQEKVKEEKERLEKQWVTVKEWSIVLKEVIPLDIEWETLQPYVVHVNKNGFISAHKFLQRFRIKVASRFGEAWQQETIDLVCHQLRLASKDLVTAFNEADLNQDNKLDYNELVLMLKKYKVNLTDNQFHDFMESMEVNSVGFISFQEFHNKFKAEWETGNSDSDQTRWLEMALQSLALEIQELWGNPKQCWKKAMKEELKEQKHNPQVQHTKITMNPKRFKKFLRKELNGSSYSDDERSALFQYINTSKDGQIAKKEFVKAFTVKKNLTFQRNVMQGIMDSIRSGKWLLEQVWRAFDVSGDGVINLEELKEGLETLNLVSDYSLTDDQITILYKALDKDGDGLIQYAEFLEAFQIVDTGVHKLQKL